MTPEAISRILEVIPSDKVKEEYFKKVEDEVASIRKELCHLMDSLCDALNKRQGTFTFGVTRHLDNPRSFAIYLSVRNNFSAPDPKNLVMFEISEGTGGGLQSNVHGVISRRFRETPIELFVEQKIKEAIIQRLGVK